MVGGRGDSLGTGDAVVWKGEGWCREELPLIDNLIGKYNC